MTVTVPRVALAAFLSLLPIGQSWAQDSVYLKTAVRPITGTIDDETPAGIKLRTRKELIPVGDILNVVYDSTGKVKIDFYNPAQRAEEAIDKAKDRKKAIAEAIKRYQLLVNETPGNQYARLRRHAEYKLAYLLARQAREQDGSLKNAIDKYKLFVLKNSNSWQITHAIQTLGELLLEGGAFDDAERLYDQAVVKNLPAQAKSQFQLLAARVPMFGKKYKEAHDKLQAIVDNSKDNRQKLQAMLYQAECQAEQGKFGDAKAKAHSVLKQAKDDKELRGLAFNTLGYTNYLGRRYKEALWDFLRVDVVYYQDREEHARALFYLADLFAKLKDVDRSKDCLAKLTSALFAGTEFQRRALKSKG